MRKVINKPDEHYNIYKFTLKSFANLNEDEAKNLLVI